MTVILSGISVKDEWWGGWNSKQTYHIDVMYRSIKFSFGTNLSCLLTGLRRQTSCYISLHARVTKPKAMVVQLWESISSQSFVGCHCHTLHNISIATREIASMFSGKWGCRCNLNFIFGGKNMAQPPTPLFIIKCSFPRARSSAEILMADRPPKYWRRTIPPYNQSYVVQVVSLNPTSLRRRCIALINQSLLHKTKNTTKPRRSHYKLTEIKPAPH
jgi:hypothetical protein